MTKSRWDFVEGDTNSKLRVTITRVSDGTPLDLTGGTATLRFRIGAGAVTERVMTVPNPTTGVAEYTFTSGELVAGQMVAEVETLSSGKVLTSLDTWEFAVRGKVA